MCVCVSHVTLTNVFPTVAQAILARDKGMSLLRTSAGAQLVEALTRQVSKLDLFHEQMRLGVGYTALDR